METVPALRRREAEIGELDSDSDEDSLMDTDEEGESEVLDADGNLADLVAPDDEVELFTRGRGHERVRAGYAPCAGAVRGLATVYRGRAADEGPDRRNRGAHLPRGSQPRVGARSGHVVVKHVIFFLCHYIHDPGQAGRQHLLFLALRF